ncbi:MAG: hypothetical protein HQL91_07205 [Magnetococcales bacterium]|nr:hypothetical protein [Magnetococcales bacterium]
MEDILHSINFMALAKILGPIFLDFLGPFLKVFRTENVAPTIAFIMLGSAVLLETYFYFAIVRPARTALEKPIRFLKALGGQNEQAARTEFAQRYDEFETIITKKGFLRHGWMEFTETILNKEPVVEISVRPSVFLSTADAEHDGLKLGLLDHWSSVFVSIGLLFTFFGLVAALSEASATISQVVAQASGGTATGEVGSAQIQRSLALLLNTASAKFWTSIAGLLSGITLGLVERHGARTVNSRFDELNRQIERVTQTVTPESLSNRMIGELQKQSEHMQQFTTQFRFNVTEALAEALTRSMPPVMTDSVSEALGDRMPKVMNDAMEPVINTLEGMADRLTTMNEDAIRKMTGDFSTVVSQSAGTEIKAVADTLATMPAQIADAAAEMRNAAQALTDGMSRITDTAEKNVDDTRRKLDAQLEAAVQGLSDAAHAIRESMEQVGQNMRSSSEQAGSAFSNEIAEAVRRIEQSTATNAVVLEEAVTKLTNATRSMTSDMSGESGKVMQALRETVEQMARSVADVSGIMSRGAQESAADVTERFLSAATAMQEAVNRNSEQVGKAVEAIVSASKAAEQGVGNAATEVGKTMSEQGRKAAAQIVDGSSSVLNQFQVTVDKLWQRVDELSATLNTVTARIGVHASALEGTSRAARETESAMSGTAATLTSATQPFARTTENLAQSMRAVSTDIGTAVRALGESQRETKELAMNLKQTVSDLQRVWSTHASRFDGVDLAVKTIFERIITNTEEHAQHLMKYVGGIDKHVESIVNTLGNNISELKETVDELVTITKNIRGR